ncbi:MAG: phosphogluconate dehydrogenase C-terminal domain-containing protein [Deinococcota bacterium]
MSTRIALMGAGGKLGCRITDNIKDLAHYQVDYIEITEVGQARLTEKGVHVSPESEALAHADVVILALPDKLIGKLSQSIVPQMKAGAMVVGLDPAAAHAEVIPLREDLSYFVTHPCHPPVFHDETTPEARSDWFGGVYAKHHIVCALHQGSEADYQLGESIARDIFAPVMDAYRITVEQMAILEPALSETFTATLITAMKEAMDEAIKMGVPAEAAEAFLMGYIRVPLAIVFGYADFPFSDGAQLAIQEGYEKIFRPDWKARIFDREALKHSVQQITH